ncbi:EAL domain-containing protein [Teredinibacter sp. KSP-S5-2]|uniref:EAL domain-containing response regulator n=1 Tax=Teredinibacter sp. KSP-S5-2 TaxID=3034506 RepID=UPI00293495D6|nr:EAL domain-containing protein [Teredinibacter sp. KSP-S5-2]WNO08138.1 EAL domain-containing protein [Teredinibacter sp. KSP-S5-2]
MNQNSTIRLLILNDSRSEAERLISMLHNAGRPVRATHVESEEALNKLLLEKSWDLMIALDTTSNVPPTNAIKTIQRLNKDIPTILLTDEEGSKPAVDGIKHGAQDVVRLDEDQHLLLVIQREVNNREERNKRRFAERRHKEIEKRNQQLLDSSRDAIAYIQDGMFLYVNDSFAELLDYESRDDLECMPVIDITKKSDQETIKQFLKEFFLKNTDQDNSALEFTALTGSGEEKKIKIQVSKSNYDEELCIQFLIRTKGVDSEELEAQLEQIKNQDMATGLFNKNYLMESMDGLVDKALNKEYSSALFHIGIEDFMETVQGKLGIASVDTVVAAIANQAKALVKKNDVLCRFSEDTFMLLVPKIDAGTALKRAESLCQKLRDYVVDIQGTTLHFNYNIGISLINETSTNSEVPVEHALKALELARKANAEDNAVFVKIYEPENRSESKANVIHMVQSALDKGRFKLLFQPILSLRGSDMEHYEVLLRMLDSEENEISPNDFLSSAAKMGATTKIDRWVILESIKMLSEHRSNGHNTRLMINLSRESLLDATLAPWLAVAFKAAKLPTEAIIFQMKEIDINDHLNVASTFTKQLAELGCETSVSHFGCALNPMNTLKAVSATHVKIDGSFTQDLQSNADNTEALNEIVSELHQLDKITIVPFVENASVLSKLWQTGVHYIQGYYLQEPADSMNYDFDMES